MLSISDKLKQLRAQQASQTTTQQPVTVVENQPKPAAPNFDADFAELDNLLAQAKAPKPKPAVKQERYADDLPAWAGDSFTIVGHIARFSVQVCQCCGYEHLHFDGYFDKKRGKRHPTVSTMTKGEKPAPDSKLPKEVQYARTYVPTCIDCTTSAGFIDPEA